MFLAAASSISLICGGGGAHHTVETGTATAWGNPGQTVTFQQGGHVGYDDEVAVEIGADGTGRIRVPDGLKPPIRSGGDDGWWPLKDIQIGEREIKAKFAMNFMNHPTVRIDRISGHITIVGRAGNFAGSCQPYDAATVQRRF